MVIAWTQVNYIPYIYSVIKPYTDNPLYTDIRYNDKIRYNDNLAVTNLRLSGKNKSQIMHEYWT